MKEKYFFYREKLRTLLQEKGMYLVVFLSLAIVGAAAAISAGGAPAPNNAAPETAHAATPTPEAASVLHSRDDRLAAAEAFRTPVPTPSPSPSPTPTLIPDFSAKPKSAQKTERPKEEAPRKAVSPVKGAVIWKFAEDELIYSQTLDQWMTHHGADVAAALESEVHCIYAGVVEDVYADDAFGHTVRVSHEDNLTSLYANLTEAIPVKAGDRLRAGDVLGRIGDSALSECGSPSHLHFEIWKDGKPVDPEEYCLFES